MVVKPFVILQKKNTITRCEFDSLQKNFFSSCKMLKLLPFYFFWQIFWNSFFFPPTFSQKCNFESTFYVVFFFVFSKFTPLQRILSNSNETDNGFTETFWNYLKLFATVIVSLKLAAKKKVVIGVKSAKSPVSSETGWRCLFCFLFFWLKNETGCGFMILWG